MIGFMCRKSRLALLKRERAALQAARRLRDQQLAALAALGQRALAPAGGADSAFVAVGENGKYRKSKVR